MLSQYKQRAEALLADNSVLQQKLSNRQIEIEKVDSIAEAAQVINDVFESIKNAAINIL